MANISVVLNTLNEGNNLSNALASVASWAKEIIVVDMYSDDNTIDIAKKYGAKIYLHEKIRDFDKARNYGIEKASNEWVFILDADEMVNYQLSLKLKLIAQKNIYDVVVIPRLNYDISVPMMHSGLGPDQDRQIRFFKKGMVNIGSKIHDFMHPVEYSNKLVLSYTEGAYIVHYFSVDTITYLEKQIKYAGIEANQKFENGERTSVIKMMYEVLRVFVSKYVRFSGWKDGWLGFNRSLYMVIYRIATYAEMMQLQEVGDSDIIKNYNKEHAAKVLKEYM